MENAESVSRTEVRGANESAWEVAIECCYSCVDVIGGVVIKELDH